MDPISAVSNLVGSVIDRIWPDATQREQAKVKLAELAANGELEKLRLENGLVQGQIETNKAEAASQSIFVAGWRPFVGWVCGSAFAYKFILQPFFCFLAALFGYDVLAHLPTLDWTELSAVLFGMMGLSYHRTQEKKAGVV